MTGSADVEVRELSKRYGQVPVLRDVSFTVPNGESMALLGPSGCGKSTTLSIIAGVTPEDSGHVIIGGRDMGGLPPHRRGIGVVFQSYALFPHMTVQRNVEFGPTVQRRDRAETRRLAEAALAMTHLTRFRDRLPRQLSGGQQQRVAIARALASQPRVLLLDEPLSNLDASLREEMQSEIRDLQTQTGISMIFVTHDQQEAMAIGDRVGVILDGEMRQVGTPEELYGRPQDIDVARTLGKINTLPATVVGRDGSAVRLRGPGGERWAGLLPSGQTAELGSRAVLMVRPETLRVVPRGGGAVVPGDTPGSAAAPGYTASAGNAAAPGNSAAPGNTAAPGHIVAAGNTVNGVLKRTTFLGRELNALVDVGFATLQVRCEPTAGVDLRAGREVTVAWEGGQSTVFREPPGPETPGEAKPLAEEAKATHEYQH